jgi:hypothetical protein
MPSKSKKEKTMGQFHVVVQAVGNHGCERDKIDGEHVVGCERIGCTDCITREFVRRLKKSGATVHVAAIDHWPAVTEYGVNPLAPSGQVQDDLLSGTRSGSF